MSFRNILKRKKMSVYRLAKVSDVPYTTVYEIVNGKVRLEKCSAETVYRLARALDISMEEMLAPYVAERCSFENFKSAICHRVKELGDIDFIADVLNSQEIRTFFDRGWFPESLYLLAMLDYVSRENEIPLCSEYDDLRQCRLEKTVYPAGVRALWVASGDNRVLQEAEQSAIPEFKRFNIIENEIRNIV